jgi:phosphoglycolate phosphatase
MRGDGVVFDLDGTLIDGYDAIHDALTYSLSRLNLPVPTRRETREMVGHGLERLIEMAAGPDRVPEGVRLFREHYPEVAVEKSRLMPGVKPVLEELERRGFPMSLASNKPSAFSRLILEARGVAGYFREIIGPDDRHPPKPDPKMLRSLIAAMGSRAESTVCVGDMEVDVEFARAAGCPVIVIPSGSRSREFLAGAGADLLIDSLEDLPAALTRV